MLGLCLAPLRRVNEGATNPEQLGPACPFYFLLLLLLRAALAALRFLLRLALTSLPGEVSDVVFTRDGLLRPTPTPSPTLSLDQLETPTPTPTPTNLAEATNTPEP